jgi:hypothetical protein
MISNFPIPKVKEFLRRCPSCGKKIFHHWQLSCELAEKMRTPCKDCLAKLGCSHEPNTSKPVILFRECASCGGRIGYTTENGYRLANKRKSLCKVCHSRKSAGKRFGNRLKTA